MDPSRPGGRIVASFAAQRLPERVQARQARTVAGTYTAISEAVARRRVESSRQAPSRWSVSGASISGITGSKEWVLRLRAGDEMDILGQKLACVLDVPPG